MKNPFSSKFVVLFGVGILLFWFLSMIQSVIAERQRYRDQAVQSVSDNVAGAQTLLGPLAYVSCTETWPVKLSYGKNAQLGQDTRDFRLFATPQDLNISSTVSVEKRKRNLFEAQVLNTEITLKAQFNPLKTLTPIPAHPNSTMKCGNPFIMLAIDDPRGIRSAAMKFNDEDFKFQAGTGHDAYKRGMRVEVPSQSAKSNEVWQIQVKLEYAGTQKLGFVPLGESTQVQLQSNWPHPSFTGRFAPLERYVSPNGFNAKWRLTSIATDAAEAARNSGALCDSAEPNKYSGVAATSAIRRCVETIDVRFIEPINFYSLSDRASKYGLLFVALTFVAVGLFEVMKKLRVHPVQYLLVGAAICTFFLLLLALSEHIGFAQAYAAGAAATTLLLMFYARFMLGGWLRGLPFGSLIALLYGMLYALLQLEQTALAIGAVALFAVLATVMVLTRKVDWYEQLSSAPATTEETLKAQPAPASFAAAQRGA